MATTTEPGLFALIARMTGDAKYSATAGSTVDVLQGCTTAW
jgi:hypothetical protein